MATNRTIKTMLLTVNSPSSFFCSFMADTLPVLVSSSFSVLLESLSEQVIVCLALLEVLRGFLFFFLFYWGAGTSTDPSELLSSIGSCGGTNSSSVNLTQLKGSQINSTPWIAGQGSLVAYTI